MYMRLSIHALALPTDANGDAVIQIFVSQRMFDEAYRYSYPFHAKCSFHRPDYRCGDSAESMFRNAWRYFRRLHYSPARRKAEYLSTYEEFTNGGTRARLAMTDYCIWLYLTHPRLRAL